MSTAGANSWVMSHWRTKGALSAVLFVSWWLFTAHQASSPCITWTYCMHPVQGAIAPRGWDLCISPPQPWIQLFNRNTKLPHCVQQGYPSYSQCLPNFEHEFQCWLNDFTYTRNRGHLRQTKKVAMCIDRLFPCLKVFIYGKWWFSTCFFTRKKSWWVLGGFWVGSQAPHLQVLFLLTLDCQWSSRHAFCCCIVVLVNDYQGTLTKTIT